VSVTVISVVRPHYTPWSIKTCHFYYLSSTVKQWPILIIFDMRRKWLLLWPPHLNTAATLPCEMQKSCSYWMCCWRVASMSTRLHSCWKRTFWAHAVMKMMWCDTCDFLRDNYCQSCLSLFSWSFLSRRMRYLVWIHCYRWSNNEFCMSQGIVAIIWRWGGQKYNYLRQVFSWCRMPRIIKIGQCIIKLFKK